MNTEHPDFEKSCVELLSEYMKEILSKRLRYKVEFEDRRYKFYEHANYLAWCKIEDLVGSILGFYKKQRRAKRSDVEELVLTENKPTLNVNFLDKLLEKKTIQNHFNLALYFMLCDIGSKRKVLPSVFNKLKEKALSSASNNDVPFINVFTCDGNVHYNVEIFKADSPPKSSIEQISKSKLLEKEVADFYYKFIKICIKYKAIIGGYILGDTKDDVALELAIVDGFNEAVRHTFTIIKAFPDFHVEYKVNNCDNRKKKSFRLEEGTFVGLENLDKILDKWYDKKRKKASKEVSDNES